MRYISLQKKRGGEGGRRRSLRGIFFLNFSPTHRVLRRYISLGTAVKPPARRVKKGDGGKRGSKTETCLPIVKPIARIL